MKEYVNGCECAVYRRMMIYDALIAFHCFIESGNKCRSVASPAINDGIFENSL